MKPMINIVCVLTLLASCNSAKEQVMIKNGKKIDYVIFGGYAGECSGHCATMYKLEGSRLLIDRTDSFFKNGKNGPTFKEDTLNRAQFKQAQFAIDSLPDALLNSSGATYGHPDDRDQGGVFIQIKVGNEIKTFYIDDDLKAIPESLHRYVKLIWHYEELNG